MSSETGTKWCRTARINPQPHSLLPEDNRLPSQKQHPAEKNRAYAEQEERVLYQAEVWLGQYANTTAPSSNYSQFVAAVLCSPPDPQRYESMRQVMVELPERRPEPTSTGMPKGLPVLKSRACTKAFPTSRACPRACQRVINSRIANFQMPAICRTYVLALINSRCTTNQ